MKKIVCLFLSLALVLGLIPANVRALEQETIAQKYQAENDEKFSYNEYVANHPPEIKAGGKGNLDMGQYGRSYTDTYILAGGEMLPTFIVKLDKRGIRPYKYEILWLYESITGGAVEHNGQNSLNDAKELSSYGNIKAIAGQYFYYPQPPEAYTSAAQFSDAGLDPALIKDADIKALVKDTGIPAIYNIQDLSHLGKYEMKYADKVTGNRQTTDGGSYTSWSNNTLWDSIDGTTHKYNANLKYSKNYKNRCTVSPMGMLILTQDEARNDKRHLGNFLVYDKQYYSPRKVYNKNFELSSYVNFAADINLSGSSVVGKTPVTKESISKLYPSPDNFPYKRAGMGIGTVNEEWLDRELANKGILAFKSERLNGGYFKDYVAVDGRTIKILDRNNEKSRLLLDVIAYVESSFGSSYKTDAYFTYPTGTNTVSNTKLAEKEAFSRGLYELTKKVPVYSAPYNQHFGGWCSVSDLAKIPQEKQRDYLDASLTWKALYFLKIAEINGYCKLADESNSAYVSINMTNANYKYYNGWTLGKVVDFEDSEQTQKTEKDLYVVGAEPNTISDSFLKSYYSNNLWTPTEEGLIYLGKTEKTWAGLTSTAEIQTKIQNLGASEWQRYFKLVDNTNEETPLNENSFYIYQNAIALKVATNGTKNKDDKTIDALNSYHFDIPSAWNMGIYSPADGKKMWDKNKAALSNPNFDENRTSKVFPSSPTAEEAQKWGTYDFQNVNINRDKSGNSKYQLIGDRDIAKGANTATTAIFTQGGRLGVYLLNNVPYSPYSAFITDAAGANEGWHEKDGYMNTKDAPESDDENKHQNMAIYRAVLKTPTWDYFKTQGKVGNDDNDAYISLTAYLKDGKKQTESVSKEYDDAIAILVKGYNGTTYNFKHIYDKAKGAVNTNDNAETRNDSATKIYRLIPKSKDKPHNLYINNVTIYERKIGGKTEKAFWRSPPNMDYSQPIDLVAQGLYFDPACDYTICYTQKFEIKNELDQNQKSHNSDLYTYAGILGNGDENGGNLEHTSGTTINDKDPWNNGETRSFNSHPPIYGTGKWDRNTSSPNYDNRVLGGKFYANEMRLTGKDIVTGDYVMGVHPKWSSSEDDLKNDNTKTDTYNDKVVIKYGFKKTAVNFDNLIAKINLIDQDGKVYEGGTMDNPAPLDPAFNPTDLSEGWQNGRVYTLQVKVKRATNKGGTAVTNIGNECGLFVSGHVGTRNIFNEELVLSKDLKHFNNNNKLTNVDDYITYELKNFQVFGIPYIDIDAVFKHKDSANILTSSDMVEPNNHITSVWASQLDYVVSDFVVSEHEFNLDANQGEIKNVNVTFCATVAIGTDEEYKESFNSEIRTTVSIHLYEKNEGEENWKDRGTVFTQADVNLNPNGKLIQIAGIMKMGRLVNNITGVQYEGTPIVYRKNAQYKFVFAINGGNSEVATSTRHRYPREQSVNYESNNTNNEGYDYIKVLGVTKNQPLCKVPHTSNSWITTFQFYECPIAETYTVCSGKPAVCSERCRGSGCFGWSETKSFSESVEIEAYFKSPETDNKWIKAGSGASLIVRAGHKFSFKAITVYKTDRMYPPAPNPYGGCAYRRRTPAYAEPSGFRNVRITLTNQADGETRVFNSYGAGFKYEHNTTEILVPETTKDIKLKYYVEWGDTNGYITDPSHPKKQLCTNASYQVEVRGPTPVTEGNSSIW